MDHPFLYTDSMMSRLLLVEEGEGLGLHNGGDLVLGLVGGSPVFIA